MGNKTALSFCSAITRYLGLCLRCSWPLFSWPLVVVVTFRVVTFRTPKSWSYVLWPLVVLVTFHAAVNVSQVDVTETVLPQPSRSLLVFREKWGKSRKRLRTGSQLRCCCCSSCSSLKSNFIELGSSSRLNEIAKHYLDTDAGSSWNVLLST